MEPSSTQSLELALEGALRKLDNTVKDETSRRLRLQILLLESDRAGLQSQLDVATKIDQHRQDAMRRAEHAQIELNHLEQELKGTICNLETQLSAETQNAAQVLLQEAQLRQELADLRSEIAREKLEATAIQKEVDGDLRAARGREAEIDRQVDQLRAKLRSTKDELQECQDELAEASRAVESNRNDLDGHLMVDKGQDALSGGQQAADRAQLDSMVDELKNCQLALMKEKRDAEMYRKEVQKDLKALKIREAELESKVDLWRSKTKSAKEQLKECQNELSQVKKDLEIRAIQKPGDSRKRPAREISIDNTIGTPDGVAGRKRPSAHRGRVDQTALGEKSLFSITPYLNRTMNVAANTPVSEADEKELDGRITTLMQPEEHQLPSSIVIPSKASPTAPQRPKTHGNTKASAANQTVLGELREAIRNKRAASKPLQRRPLVTSSLENVEEEVNENVHLFDQQLVSTAVTKKSSTTKFPDRTDDADQKKKKRKILGGGKTLFDEDDGEIVKKAVKVSLGPARSLSRGGQLKNGLKPGFNATAAFGGFSPLKKDKRGVNASFLG